MALNRCVTPRKPSPAASPTRSRAAAEWPADRITPPAANRVSASSATRSGANVTRTRAFGASVASPVRKATSPSSGVRMKRGSCTPGRSGLRNGPSRCTPSTPLPGSAAAASAARAACSVRSRSSVMKVGSSPTVPEHRSAAAMDSAASTVGWSLNSTPPAPFDLRVDETRSEQAPLRQTLHRGVGRRRVGQQIENTSVFDQHPCPSSVTSPVNSRHPNRKWRVTSRPPRARPSALPGCPRVSRSKDNLKALIPNTATKRCFRHRKSTVTRQAGRRSDHANPATGPDALSEAPRRRRR